MPRAAGYSGGARMKRVLVLLLCVIFFVSLRTEPASADNKRYLYGRTCGPYPASCWSEPPSYVQPKQRQLQAEGILRYCFIQESGRNITEQVEGAVFELWSDLGLTSQEDCASPLLTIYATSGSAYNYGSAKHFGCSAGSIGCLPSYGMNINIVLDAGAMRFWQPRDVTAVLLHELMHAVADAGEMYAHTGGQIGCKRPVVPTVMSCGPANSDYLTAFDGETYSIFHRFSAPPIAWLDRHSDGTPFVAWANESLDERARYLVIVFSEPDGVTWWSRPEFFVERADVPFQGVLVPELAGRCIWIKAVADGIGYYARWNTAWIACF